MKIIIKMAFLFLCTSVFLNSAQISLVKTIGDQRENYTFFDISSAAISQEKDIFVFDSKGVFLAKFNWNGNYIGRIGRAGQGPSEFHSARSVVLYKNRLYVLDRGNHRIIDMNLDLKDLKYLKTAYDARLDGKLVVLKENRFLGEFLFTRENGDKIGIFDSQGILIKSFFNNSPVKLPVIDKQDQMRMARQFMMSKETAPVIGSDINGEMVLISFEKPDNPIQFYIYNTKGQLLKEFSYPIEDEKYKFSRFFIDATSEAIMDPKRYPEKTFSPYIYSQFIHDDCFVVFLWLQEFSKKELINNTSYCLVFDKNGKIVDKLEVDSQMKFFCISKDGYLLGSKPDEETTRLYVYKLTW